MTAPTTGGASPAPHRTPDDLVVLHLLRCAGASTSERIQALIGRPDLDAEGELLALAARGHVRPDRSAPHGPAGWVLTDGGRAHHRERIAADLAAGRAEPAVRAAHAAFEPVNAAVLAACTAWQIRDAGPPLRMNDHTDPEHDVAVLDRLAAIHADAEAVLAPLAAALARFEPYAPRLAACLDAARAGDLERVTGTVDSYHTTWFVLHEDLLVTLGIERWSAG